MAKEVEMADALEASSKGKDAPSTEPHPSPSEASVQEQLAAYVRLIEKAVQQKDTRSLFSRLLRTTQTLRKKLTPSDVQEFVLRILPVGLPSAITILDHLKQADSMDAVTGPTGEASVVPVTSEPLPEIEIYAYLLALMVLIDAKQWSAARSLAEASIARISTFNRRTLDVLASRVYSYLSWTSEKCGESADLRSSLLAFHRTAVLHHDEIGQETLLNLLLRNYLAYNQYDQAEALRAKAQRDIYRSPQQHCRLLYYQGRIRAVRLEYTDARDALMQALRKAPTRARGFRIAVMKWLTTVRLLLGEIPVRSELEAPDIRGALEAYAELASVVRKGDLTAFGEVVSRQGPVFQADGTINVIGRLRANVIRAGLRRIAAAYSKISLPDVAIKLGLSSTEDAEFVVAKAIRDGGVAARIDHHHGTMIAAGAVDVYTTDEPQIAFHARIAFCMDVHNEAQRAMRYEPRSQKLEWEEANEARERQENELAAALEEEDADF